jgi:hypothetical protein
MPNPSTFTSQHRKALRDAFFDSDVTFAAAMARTRRQLAAVGWVRPWLGSAMEGLRATLRRPFGIENRWMATMCGWRLVFASGTICEGRSYSVIPTFSRCRATTAAMSAAGWLDGNGQMVCLCLGFGLFPALSLWITQVSGNKFCDGIVNKTSDSAKTTQSSAPSTRRVLSYPMVYHARARE